MCVQPVQHCRPRNLVIGADSINGHHSRIRVQLGQPLDDVSHALTASSSREGVLERCRRGLHLWCQLLSHGARNQPSHHISHEDAPDQSVRLRNAVILPILMASITVGVMRPCATCSANLHNHFWSVTESKRGRKCSTVIPGGPAAAPLFADLTFFKNLSLSNANGTRCVWLMISRGTGPSNVEGFSLVSQLLQRRPGAWRNLLPLQNLPGRRHQFPTALLTDDLLRASSDQQPLISVARTTNRVRP